MGGSEGWSGDGEKISVKTSEEMILKDLSRENHVNCYIG